MEKSQYLTDAFHERGLKGFMADILQYHSKSETSSSDSRNAIYFGTEFDAAAASTWLAFALLISVLCGVATGIGVGDWNMALNLGTAIFTILSTLHGILVLILRGR
jgi:hypothetical protein